MDRTGPEKHLTDAELLDLAAPASGEPEPLPRHLSTCEPCSRALQEWRSAMREVAREDVAELERRTPEEWRAASDATMAAIRAAKPRRTTSRRVVRWAVGIAAAALVVALAMPFRRAPTPAATAGAAAAGTSDMAFTSEADRADDALLRDAEYLAQGGDDHADIALEESL